MKYAKRVDDNQLELVRLLNDIPGVKCDVLGQPVDLLVGYRGRNYLFEVKRPDKIGRKSAYTEKQKKWLLNWPGHISVVATFDDVWNEISGAMK